MKKFCYILLVFIGAACETGQKLNPEAYIQYLDSDKSELLIVKEVNGISYKLRLMPPEYIVLKRYRGQLNKNEIEEQVKNYSNQLSFVFVVEDSDKSQNRVKSAVFDAETYGNILGYANTGLKNDLMLLTEGDTIYCHLIHVEPANSLQPVVRLSLAFDMPKNISEKFTFLFNDNIFNNGPLKFNYSKQILSGLPELKL